MTPLRVKGAGCTRVLLGSGGIGTDERRSLYRQLVSNHLMGCDSLLFIPYAAHDHAGYTDRISESLSGDGVTVRGIHEEDDPIEALAVAWSVYKPQLDDYVTRALDPSEAPSYGVPGDE